MQCLNKVCECVTNYVGYKSAYSSHWSSSSAKAIVRNTATNICLHKDTTMNLGEGAQCIYSGSLALKLCRKGFTCKVNACPLVGSTFQNVCIRGLFLERVNHLK